MIDRILLIILKSRLKTYKHNAKWYHKQGAIPNWYDEQGIPDLEREIKELEVKIKVR